ncbi:MAG: type II toxin-antitoxin system RelE/ParE family toxin [Clostridiales bacterium]|jgi:plasmid stabilization system protein ParE|nr:type II toxin-antitoxin system RelE/ParE family toxin [Clostridiales bacterium]
MAIKYHVRMLSRANKDITIIEEALKEYPQKAGRLFAEIDEKLLLLEDMPYMWPVYQPRPEYRIMVLEDHVLFYVVDESQHIVKVYRIIYGRRYIPDLLND